MERKVGEIFEYNGEWYQCVEGAGCYQCAFNRDENTCTADSPYCTCRSDKKDVVFKKLEKVGEPFKSSDFDDRIVMLQSYKMLTIPYISGVVCYIHYDTNIIDIEIKQTKEDMEENNDGNTPLNELTDKYVNGSINYDEFEKEVKSLYSCKKEDMEKKKIQHYDCFFDRKPTLKKFDLEAAKAGKPVCTRDGRKARIICFDRKSETPITALVTELNGIEAVYSYHNNGIWDSPENTNGCDLMMLPEKKEGWVNVYKERCYESKEEAIRHIAPGTHYIDTIRVEWGE